MVSTPKTLVEAVQHFADLDVCGTYMESVKWPDGRIICPKCGGDKIGRVVSRRLLQCKAIECRKQFSAKVGTVIEDSPIPLTKWFPLIWAIANGVQFTDREFASALAITYKSAWLMRKRIEGALRVGESLEMST
jgi:Transposase zinc-ribbon domain